jgi:hypothetical protein
LLDRKHLRTKQVLQSPAKMLATLRNGARAQQRVRLASASTSNRRRRRLLPASSDAAAYLQQNRQDAAVPRSYSGFPDHAYQTKLVSTIKKMQSLSDDQLLANRISNGTPILRSPTNSCSEGEQSKDLRSVDANSNTRLKFSSPFRAISVLNIPFDNSIEKESNGHQMVQRAHFSTQQRHTFATSAKIPTPEPPPESQGILSKLQSIDPKEMAVRALTMTWNIVKTVLIFLVKAPGNIFYYMTHGQERREKIQEIKDAAKKEFDHYWMGSKVS